MEARPTRRDYAEFAAAMLQAVNQEMYGLENVVRLCMVALYARGHVLLEGNPGLGKTELVKTLGKVLKLPAGRIQFTPDLMPADITGTAVPRFVDGSRVDLEFEPGPIFTSLLLADEINRATPKTQAAMLEAMAEKQVTVRGSTYLLDEYNFKPHVLNGGVEISPQRGRPFMVLATQNPIDHEGTYDLPEAQSDRFMFKLLMPVPNSAVLALILNKTASAVMSANGESEQSALQYRLPQDPQSSTNLYLYLHPEIRRFPVTTGAQIHIANLFLATNRQLDQVDMISNSQRAELQRLLEWLQFGVGPRAATALMLAAKAWAYLFEFGVEATDYDVLAKVMIPTLRHRLKMKYGWEEELYDANTFVGVEEDRRLDRFIADLSIACAPERGSAGRDYRKDFAGAINAMAQGKSY